MWEKVKLGVVMGVVRGVGDWGGGVEVGDMGEENELNGEDEGGEWVLVGGNELVRLG